MTKQAHIDSTKYHSYSNFDKEVIIKGILRGSNKPQVGTVLFDTDRYIGHSTTEVYTLSTKDFYNHLSPTLEINKALSGVPGKYKSWK